MKTAKSKKPKCDYGDLMDFVSDFIIDVVDDKNCAVTKWDVMNVMLEVLSAEVTEYGTRERHGYVARLIDKAQREFWKLPVKRHYHAYWERRPNT